MIYRREIDGLRAVAVVPVILFHAGFSWFSGGYVGVDVFFVISGFLITSIILDECEAGTFSIAGFYERRARRILPALFFMMFCTIPFAWFWMPPSQLKQYADSLVATALFYSNYQFWSEVGYFASEAAEKPLLHTWSLAIEEQFYLFFPVLVWMFWFLGRKKLAIGIGIVALASFALSVFAYSPFSEANFYLMPSRAWELLAGSLLAFGERDRPLHTRFASSVAQVLSGFGLAMIVYSVVAYDEHTPFSGISMLLPVAATCILLAFATTETFVGRFLSQRWLVAVGLVSYSAYLWHQPLFAFARLRSITTPSPYLFGFLCLVVGILAYLSWRYVEMPFRNRRRFARTEIFTFATVAAIVGITLGLTGSLTGIGHLRFANEEVAAIEPKGSKESDCEWQTPLSEFPKIQICNFGFKDSNAPIVLWGDSHADALLAAADESFKAIGSAGFRIRNDYCSAIVGVYNSRGYSLPKAGLCERSQAALLDLLRNLKPRAVIISIRWTFRLFPVEGRIEELGFNNGEGGQENETYRTYSVPDSSGRLVTGSQAKSSAIEKFIANFTTLGAPVLIQYPVPEVGQNVPNLNFKHLISTGSIPPIISTSARRFNERNAFVIGVLDSIVEEPAVLAIKVSEVLCDSYVADRCVAQINGVPLYFDDDHLSKEGAKLVIAEILKKLK